MHRFTLFARCALLLPVAGCPGEEPSGDTMPQVSGFAGDSTTEPGDSSSTTGTSDPVGADTDDPWAGTAYDGELRGLLTVTFTPAHPNSSEDQIGMAGGYDATRPLREVRVYQGGVLTDQIAAGENAQTVTVDVERLRGARWASLVAVDQDGLASLPMGRDLGVDPGGKADMHVLAIGVDRYRADGVPDLGFAVADARRLVRSLADTEDTDVLAPSLMFDDAATPSAILQAAGKVVETAKPGDTIIFFFAGHGLKGRDGRFYMATSAADPDDIAGTALAWDDLARVLAQANARVIVFLDACHSGAAGTDFFATNDDAARGILRNIPSGLVVFSASKGREVSLENAEVGGGFFTTAVAEVIAADRSRHDTSGNGAIEISELYSGVKRLVVERTDGRQTPWLARNRMIGDFALF